MDAGEVTKWLNDLPPVPNWLNWSLAILTFVAIVVVPISVSVWRHSVADRLATRSSIAAKKRAAKLARSLIEAHCLCRNRPAMFARGVRCLWASIFGIGTMAIALIAKTAIYSPLGLDEPATEYAVWTRTIISWVIFALGYVFLFISVREFLKIKPLLNIGKRTEKSKKQIQDLFEKAKVSNDVATARMSALDEKLAEISKQDIK